MFGGGKQLVIGLDVGSYSVKAVALQTTKGRLVLQGYSQMRVSDEDQMMVIRQVMDHLGVRSKQVVTAVSGRSVIVRQVETPRLDKNELKSHMTYEADKYIPFSADEVVMDTFALPDREGAAGGNMDVLLVAARKGFVEDYVHMLQDAGTHPSVVDVDIFALCNAYWTLGPAAGGDNETTALVDIGAAKSWVAIVKGNRLLFQREIYLAGNEITDAIVRTFNESPEDVEEVKLNPGDMIEALLDAAMPAFEDLANEIRLSFDYVEGQFDEEVQRVVLSGGSSLLPSLPDILGNILGRPVLVFDPLSGVDLITSRYDLHSLEANAPGLTVALGLACHMAASGDVGGLGGMQVAAWQPRRSRKGGTEQIARQAPAAAAPAPAPAMAEEATETVPLSPEPAPPPAPAPPLEMPSVDVAPNPTAPSLGVPIPPTEAGVPAQMAPPITEPSSPAIVPPATQPAAAIPSPGPNETLPAPGPNETDLSSPSQVFDGQEPSAMLVVLDDDDDSSIGNSDAYSNPNISSLPPEVSEDDDDNSLPPLPG